MNLRAFVCVWIGWEKKKKKQKSLKFGGSTPLVIFVMWNFIGSENVLVLSYSIRYIQNCHLESYFPLAGDSVNIPLLLVLHVLELVAERDLRLEETRSERSTHTTIRIVQKVPNFRESDELGAAALKEASLMVMHRDQSVRNCCHSKSWFLLFFYKWIMLVHKEIAQCELKLDLQLDVSRLSGTLVLLVIKHLLTESASVLSQ